MPLERPRPHHYVFAHRWLPGILLDDRIDVLDLVVSGRFDTALVNGWQAVGLDHDPTERLDPRGLSARLLTDRPPELLLITLPAALGPVEAHFVALTPCAPAGARRFFTLELAAPPSPNLYAATGLPVPAHRDTDTVLGMWSSSGHHNLGEGPWPSADAFVEAVRSRMGPR